MLLCFVCQKELPRKHKITCSRTCEGIRRQKGSRFKFCIECGKKIGRCIPNKNSSISLRNWARKKYCSNRCKGAGYTKYESKEEPTCLYCEELILNATGKKLVRKKFCSKLCYRSFLKLKDSQARLRLVYRHMNI